MKKRTLLYAILFTTILTSCTTKQNTPKDIKRNIQVKSFVENIGYDDIIDQVKYIKLETNADCLVGKIAKMLYSKDKIYILSDVIHVFSHKGKHLFSIDKKGSGPTEFVSPYDFSISGNNLYLYDNSQSKILCFNAENGHFVNEYRIPHSGIEMKCIDNKVYLNTGQIYGDSKKEGKLWAFDIEKPNSVEKHFKQDVFDLNMENQLIGNNNACFWIEPLRCNVYKLTKNGKMNYLHYDFGTKNLSEGQMKAAMSANEITDTGKAHFLSNVYETTTHIYATIFLRNNRYQIIHDKRTNHTIAVQNIVGDMYQLMSTPTCSDGDYFYSCIDGGTTKLMMDIFQSTGKTIPAKFRENYEAIRKTTDDDNPTILKFKFK